MVMRAAVLLIAIVATHARADRPPSDLARSLASGLPVRVEVVVGEIRIGDCTIMFDLWDQHYRVERGSAFIGTGDLEQASELCVDPSAIAIGERIAAAAWLPTALTIRELATLGPINQAPSDVWCGVTSEARAARHR